MKYFDWQKPAWISLFAAADSFPPALLVSGEPGWGQDRFAHAVAHRLLCDEARDPAAPACGRCESCRWLAAESHPDFRFVTLEEEEPEEEGASSKRAKKPSTQIKIDQIRVLEDFVFKGSHRHGNRVIFIHPAEAMNVSAANSLLKILEESPSSVYFVLSSSAWRRLLPTVLSRCRRLVLPRPDGAAAAAWLKAEGLPADMQGMLPFLSGAPVAVRDWAADGTAQAARAILATLRESGSDPVSLAARWSTIMREQDTLDQTRLVGIVQKWLSDLVLYRTAGRLRFTGGFPGWAEKAAQGLSVPRLLACYNDLLRIRRVSSHPLNAQLFLEDLAARFLQATAVKS